MLLDKGTLSVLDRPAVCRLRCWPLTWIYASIFAYWRKKNHRSLIVIMHMCMSWCACVFLFYKPAPAAVLHVLIGHGGTWKPVAHCALCSSDGQGLSCSTPHFIISISSHGWEAFFPPVVWNNRDGKCLVYFLQKKDSIRQQGHLLLFWSRTRSLMWFPFVSDVFWLILSNQSPFVSW